MRFFLSTVLFLLVLVCTAVGMFWYISHVTKKDYLEYERLLQSSNTLQKRESFFATQFRRHVIKEIWFGHQHPLYVRIACDRSELIAFKEKEGIQTIEKMTHVKSLLQEKLFYLLPDGRKGVLDDEGLVVVKEAKGESKIDPSIKSLTPMQEVRYFEAEKGVCGYKNLDFIGEDVKMKKYRLKGHTPPLFFPNLTPLVTGEGKKVYFALKDKKIDLRLEAFETTFDPNEGI